MRPRNTTAPPRTRRAAAALAVIALGFAWSACGEGDEPAETGASSDTATPATTTQAPALTGPEVTEAAPEAEPAEDETSELSEEDEAAVAAAVNAYIEGLNAHDGSSVCALFIPGAIRFEGGDLPPSRLPAEPKACAAALASAIGRPPPRGGPAWKRTTIEGLNEVSVGPDRARVTATVVTRFADRKQPSVEDDVIYLDRAGERWLLAKPSGTLYRAVGYPEPPLRSLSPPEN
jgi:hypothetical protein